MSSWQVGFPFYPVWNFPFLIWACCVLSSCSAPHQEPGFSFSASSSHVLGAGGSLSSQGRCCSPFWHLGSLCCTYSCHSAFFQGKGMAKPQLVFQAWSSECWAEEMIPSHKLRSLLCFSWGWVQNTSFPYHQKLYDINLHDLSKMENTFRNLGCRKALLRDLFS